MTHANDPLPIEVEDDPKRPYKAIAATVLTAVGTFIAWWISDTGDFTSKEVGEAILAALVAAGVTGGATFAVPNPLVTKVAPRRSAGGSL
jgi:hypothetical protein